VAGAAGHVGNVQSKLFLKYGIVLSIISTGIEQFSRGSIGKYSNENQIFFNEPFVRFCKGIIPM
jgi:hypothetical protein